MKAKPVDDFCVGVRVVGGLRVGEDSARVFLETGDGVADLVVTLVEESELPKLDTVKVGMYGSLLGAAGLVLSQI